MKSFKWVGELLRENDALLSYSRVEVTKKQVVSYYNIGDTVIIKSNNPARPYVAEIDSLSEDKISKEKFLVAKWYYHQQDITNQNLLKNLNLSSTEVLYSNHKDRNALDLIISHCFVLFMPTDRIPPVLESRRTDLYFCRYEFHTMKGKVTTISQQKLQKELKLVHTFPEHILKYLENVIPDFSQAFIVKNNLNEASDQKSHLNLQQTQPLITANEVANVGKKKVSLDKDFVVDWDMTDGEVAFQLLCFDSKSMGSDSVDDTPSATTPKNLMQFANDMRRLWNALQPHEKKQYHKRAAELRMKCGKVDKKKLTTINSYVTTSQPCHDFGKDDGGCLKKSVLCLSEEERVGMAESVCEESPSVPVGNLSLVGLAVACDEPVAKRVKHDSASSPSEVEIPVAASRSAAPTLNEAALKEPVMNSSTLNAPTLNAPPLNGLTLNAPTVNTCPASPRLDDNLPCSSTPLNFKTVVTIANVAAVASALLDENSSFWASEDNAAPINSDLRFKDPVIVMSRIGRNFQAEVLPYDPGSNAGKRSLEVENEQRRNRVWRPTGDEHESFLEQYMLAARGFVAEARAESMREHCQRLPREGCSKDELSVDGALVVVNVDLQEFFLQQFYDSKFNRNKALLQVKNLIRPLIVVWSLEEQTSFLEVYSKVGFNVAKLKANENLRRKSTLDLKEYFLRFVRSAEALEAGIKLSGDAGTEAKPSLGRLRQSVSVPDLSVTSAKSDLAGKKYADVLNSTHFLLRFMKTFDSVSFGQLLNVLVALRANALSPAELVRSLNVLFCLTFLSVTLFAQLVRVRYILHNATTAVAGDSSAATGSADRPETTISKVSAIVAYSSKVDVLHDFVRHFLPEALHSSLSRALEGTE